MKLSSLKFDYLLSRPSSMPPLDTYLVFPVSFTSPLLLHNSHWLPLTTRIEFKVLFLVVSLCVLGVKSQLGSAPNHLLWSHQSFHIITVSFCFLSSSYPLFLSPWCFSCLCWDNYGPNQVLCIYWSFSLESYPFASLGRNRSKEPMCGNWHL